MYKNDRNNSINAKDKFIGKVSYANKDVLDKSPGLGGGNIVRR